MTRFFNEARAATAIIGTPASSRSSTSATTSTAAPTSSWSTSRARACSTSAAPRGGLRRHRSPSPRVIAPDRERAGGRARAKGSSTAISSPRTSSSSATRGRRRRARQDPRLRDRQADRDGGRWLEDAHRRPCMGTPVYMSPGAVPRPRHVDHRSDIYALGLRAVRAGHRAPRLRQGSLGRPPGRAHHRDAAPGVGLPAGDSELDGRARLRMLAKGPDDRPSSMDEIVTAMESFLQVRASEFATRIPTTSALAHIPTPRKQISGPAAFSPTRRPAPPRPPRDQAPDHRASPRSPRRGHPVFPPSGGRRFCPRGLAPAAPSPRTTRLSGDLPPSRSSNQPGSPMLPISSASRPSAGAPCSQSPPVAWRWPPSLPSS